MAIKVVVDSTSYIPKGLREEYDISVIPLSVVFSDGPVLETEITNEEFYSRLEQEDEIPKSSQPMIEDVYNLFESIVKNGDEIIGVFISSEMSGTFSTANMVKEMILDKYPKAKIELIDSRSNCMQLGYAAITAARAAKEGKSLEEVVQAVKGNIKRSKFVFIPDTLEYLRKGGRIGTAKALLGSLLQLKPILTVIDGKTDVITKVRSKKKAIEKMVEIFLEDIKKYGLGEVIVHHINCEAEAKELANTIKNLIDKGVDICSIGPVIGVHVGPGALGIVYYTKEEIG
ncbi:EDD domain protein, DegV family [Anaerobranca californiensis DSM 14826]|jgi:DegV family protein with EDD domain|uniref:EDD domain protein, DegV family n=1 Tax=Anaerobranca californiensis DSM 14826 TaxID=1120989 RepID=A0A1M6MWQ6_9FIRM|nr:DegV family protein [Anaerobranca californiensis]SHJ87810.1 EDD domain protein, DegV family [Anaerobranca californiensis DSM 14826]